MKLLVALTSLFLFLSVVSAAPVANAGLDRSALVNVAITLDGSGSSGYLDGMRTISGSRDKHTIMWTFGYDNWNYSGGVIAPIAYPEPGTFTAILTVCDATSCASDSTTITVTNISVGSEIIMTDSGNSVTNLANLQSEVDNSTGANNRLITLPIGWVSKGTLILKHRTVANYLTIRSANFSTSNSLTRVSPLDASDMVTFETDHAGISIIETVAPSSSPSRYYRFIGIRLRKTDPALSYSRTFVVIGNNETSLSQLPNNILFDRCYFDGGSDTSNTLRGVLFRASDSGVVNSYFSRFKGVAIETQAALTLMGERQAFINNFMEASTENYMAGGSDATITNHNPTDIVFMRNHLIKPLIWNPSDPSYLGVNMSIKNLFELKTVVRMLIQANRFEVHWIEDQPGYAVIMAPRNQDGGQTWAQVSHIDFSYNQIHKVSRGLNVFGSDDLHPSLQTTHMFIAHNVWSGMGYQDSIQNFSIITDGPTAGIDRFQFVRNTSDHNGDIGNSWGRTINFEPTTKHTNFVWNGNIVQGHFIHNGGSGATAFQLATGGSYQAVKNCFHRSVGTNPADNTTVSLISDVKFLDLAGFNLALANDSPCLTSGLDGGRAGADVAAVNDYNLHTIDGNWPSEVNSVIVCNWHTAQICN